MTKTRKYLGYFSGWENENCWRIMNLDGTTVAMAAKRTYQYETAYILYIRNNKVVKTKVAPKRVQTLFHTILEVRAKVFNTYNTLGECKISVLD